MHTFVSSFKGLVVDLEDGNLVKLAEDGTVLRYALWCMKRIRSASQHIHFINIVIAFNYLFKVGL